MPIPISQGEMQAAFFYKDGWLYWKGKTGSRTFGRRAGCIKPNGYVKVRLNGTYYQASRLIWVFHHGDTPLQIDHIDANPTNNRIENLRAVTQAENQRCRKSVWGAIPLKGVCLNKKTGRFIAQIGVGPVRHRLGEYDTPELAHAAYVEAAKKFHGEFAGIPA